MRHEEHHWGGRELEPVSRKSTEQKGPEGVHRSGLKSMTVEKAEVYGKRRVGWWEESLFVS